MPKRFSTFKIKKNLLYTTAEVAKLLGAKQQTVQQWIWRQGLQTVDDRIPHLVRGSALSEFIKTKNNRKRQKCALHEFYCFACKAPRPAAFNEADLVKRFASGGGLLSALCPVCACSLHKWVSCDQFAAFAQHAKVAMKAVLHTQNDTWINVIGDSQRRSQCPLQN